jgi:RimK family alpha-L-glutamate ligase
MKAWLVVNEFLRNDKFMKIEEWFIQSALKYDVNLSIKTNVLFLKEYGQKPDCVIYWDKDVKLASYLEDVGIPVYNSSQAIAICDDKALTHMVLAKEDVPMPKTIAVPMTYTEVGYTNYDFLCDVERLFTYPIILKECYGSFGKQVYKIENRKDMEQKLKELAGKPLIFQEFVETSFARDVRLQVVGGQVIAAMYRYSDTGDFRANASNGGKIKPYQPTEGQCELALRCCKAINLDFAGVDLLFGEGDKPLVCEVNSNAHFINVYDCTGVNTADAIMEMLSEKVWPTTPKSVIE